MKTGNYSHLLREKHEAPRRKWNSCKSQNFSDTSLDPWYSINPSSQVQSHFQAWVLVWGLPSPWMTKRLHLEVLAFGIQFYRSFFQNPMPLNAMKCLASFSFTSGTWLLLQIWLKKQHSTLQQVSCGPRCRCYKSMQRGKTLGGPDRVCVNKAELSVTCDHMEMPWQ